MQEPPDTRGARSGDYFLGKIRVHGAKSCSSMLVEYPDQIDDDVDAAEESGQHTRIVNVGPDQADGIEYPELIIAGR